MPELLADHTTLRVGGPATEFVVARTQAELIDQVATADASGMPVLLLGAGSNVLVADDGFDGRVVAIRTRGRQVSVDECGGADVRVEAGESWDHLAADAVVEGWVGSEALAGIPGSVGATPIQNVGAYGQEVAQTIASVRCWDRSDRELRTFLAADCGFGYRTSRFKEEAGRYAVLEVGFRFRLGGETALGAPLEYAELASALGRELGDRAPLSQVRAAVLGLRASKGMLLDDTDHDTWSAGSFFTNPVLNAADVPPEAPSWPQLDGRVKTSAAWLIEHAGFDRGYALGPAALSGKHTLALTNRGGAVAEDLLALARRIRTEVRDRFGIELVNEPVLIGCQL